MTYTPAEAEAVFGFKISNKTIWPYGLETPMPGVGDSVGEWTEQFQELQERRGVMISWALHNGLTLDSRRTCCLAWLLRRAGSCLRCHEVPAGAGTTASLWRALGGVNTGRGHERTIPAAISLAPLEYSRWAADHFNRRYLDETDIEIGDDWGVGPQIILYRRDRLPDLEATAPPLA